MQQTKLKLYITFFLCFFGLGLFLLSPFLVKPKLNLSQLIHSVPTSFIQDHLDILEKHIPSSLIKNTRMVHVYLDPASTPALLQMTNFVKQDPNDIKIVIWDRYVDHIKNKDTYKNTYFFTAGNFFKKTKHSLSDLAPHNRIVVLLNYILYHNKKIRINLHFNLEHTANYEAIIQSSAKMHLDSVHIYEDANAWLLQDSTRDWVFQETPYTKYLYYWGDYKKLCSKDSIMKRCSTVEEFKKTVVPININYNTISKKLTEKEKEIIFNLSGLDYEKTKQFFHNKDVFIYVLGAHWHHPNVAIQLSGLKSLCTPDKTWYFKYHPNKKYQPTYTVLNHLCPGIQKLDAHIPFELLLIGGLKPKGVAGFSSSLFFPLNKEDILLYIPREYDRYIPILKQAQLIDESNTLDTAQQEINLKENNIYWLKMPNDKQFWTWKKDNQTMCNILKDECFKILEETPKMVSIQFTDNQIINFEHIETYKYKAVNKQ